VYGHFKILAKVQTIHEESEGGTQRRKDAERTAAKAYKVGKVSVKNLDFWAILGPKSIIFVASKKSLLWQK